MSRPGTVRRPASYEDLLAVPDHLVAEILDGQLHTAPRPGPRHRPEHGRWLLLATFAGDVRARIEPFEVAELELWRVWGRSEPR